MRILISGDLHIGRSSSRIPAPSWLTTGNPTGHDDTSVLGDPVPGGVDPRPGSSPSAAAAWMRLVELAGRTDADLLVLAGDVIDEAQRFFEALGVVERGLDALARRGTRVVAVAGNHDHDVLPRIADRVGPDRLRLLGRGGAWTREPFATDAVEIDLVGWSFPTAHVDDDPMTEPWPPGDRPTLAIVHGDLDVAGSRYAPLHRARLRATPVSGWIVGHVHAPRLDVDADPFILVPGSLQALDPGEPGAHGAWTVDVRDGRFTLPRFHALSSVRYESVGIDTASAETVAGLEQLVTDGIRAAAAAASGDGGSALDAFAVRAVLEGPCALPRAERADVLRRLAELDIVVERTRVVVQESADRCTPAADVSRLARGTSAPALLARVLLELETPGAQPSATLQALMEDARRAAHGAAAEPGFVDLPALALDDDEAVRRRLLAQARALLGALLEQQS